MASSRFVRALLTIAETEGNTSTLETIRNAAQAKLLKGEIKSLVSSTFEGKSSSYDIRKPADELFTDADEAIRLYNNGIIKVTQFDFTNI